MAELTPMMKQYTSIKKDYPDMLLFYRMGDFYEMFGEDAIIGSKALEITLTARGAGGQGKVPMCGIPYHAADTYVAKLIAQGLKVAICEQVEDPKLAKGIVKREVIRVITPGTLVDGSLLKEASANYLAAVSHNGNGYGIAYSDISTGEFYVAEVKGIQSLGRLADELARINPSEVVLSKDLLEEDFFRLHIWTNHNVTLTALSDELFVRRNAETLLLTQFKTTSLEALGLNNMPMAVFASAALINTVQITQKRQLDYINRLQVYNIDAYMVLDATTRRNLELTVSIRNNDKYGSLFWVLDETKCAMGARLLKEWLEKPLLESALINQRLDAVENLLNSPLVLSALREQLKEVYDLERLIGRVAYGNANPRDLTAMRQSLSVLPTIEGLLTSLSVSLYKDLYDQLDPLDDICKLIAETIVDEPPVSAKDGGLIRPGFNKQVDELRSLSGTGKDWLIKLEADEKEKTKIKSLKVGFNKVFGYYIEVTNSNLDLVPDNYIRKQTLVNGERYITEELKEWENKILGAAEKQAALEFELFNELRQKIISATVRIQRTASCLAHLDVLQSLAVSASNNGYNKPIVDNENIIHIIQGRHPVVEKSIGRENYVANDAYLDNESCFALITGPNMAGKSTYMRQIALCVLMARIGSFVPAEAATIGKTDRIFTRVGASDDLAAGQSTFMVEMCETSNILRNATPNSLIILDEIGRGTSTYDGLSIAWAVSEYILQPNLRAKTLFATHYHELIQLAESYPQVKNYSVAVKEQGEHIVFLRQIVDGGTDRSYGIHVARLAGLPEQVIRRAREILAALEADGTNKELDLAPMQSLLPEPHIMPAHHPVLEDIKALDLNNISPLEAMLYLDKWQKELKKG